MTTPQRSLCHNRPILQTIKNSCKIHSKQRIQLQLTDVFHRFLNSKRNYCSLTWENFAKDSRWEVVTERVSLLYNCFVSFQILHSSIVRIFFWIALNLKRKKEFCFKPGLITYNESQKKFSCLSGEFGNILLT